MCIFCAAPDILLQATNFYCSDAIFEEIMLIRTVKA